MEIVLDLGTLVVRLPTPKQLVASGVKEALEAGGRSLLRATTATCSDAFAILDFEELPGGVVTNGPFGGHRVTLVRWLRGISSVEEAKVHFFAEHENSVSAAFRETPTAISTDEFDDFLLLQFDLGEAGWAPGNTWHYLLLKKLGGAIAMAPTHYLEFDWSKFAVAVATKTVRLAQNQF
jgi:hypothetical protein